ncbi:hypothetical protein [Frigoriflavimonas asaccharolytica]|uniref:Uncharacterized protein n=1 Tax=Frigoriflavimonas asaccharolytica TaxID=2735899 RepID=A0A8J8G7I5_9FLAO|nr:hypothetical protein [Frigoriflavimonas asaccharolytica]NRS91392.1 hypothetical protein [Frigoriflavimonas asaccharolytica]
MKKFNLVIILLSLLVVFSCKKDKEILTDEVPSTEMVEDSMIVQDSSEMGSNTIQTFASPPEIQGCSSKFAANESDFKQGKFVYVDDYGNTAFVKINNKIVKISMEEGDFDPSDISKTLKSETGVVTMKGQQIKQVGESTYFKGEMTIENKNGTKNTTPIYGKCGC